MQRRDRFKSTFLYCVIFFLSFALVFGVYFIGKYVPFGDKSIAFDDANIQYLDLFAYLKDVLNGSASISYSFSKMLGGNTVSVFSYYLSSPFNLLVVFFSKENLLIFYHLLTALKIAAAATTCAVFLRHRFDGLRPAFLVLLSLGYGMMQYNILQSRNIMWLDGVYMLPLILLGVYRLVNKRKIGLLSVSVGLAILFNWYSGAIDCLFSAFWLVLEWIIYLQKSGKRFRIRPFFMLLWSYFYTMLLGVGLSAALFIPSVMAMRSGRAGIDWNIFSKSFIGNPLSMIQGLMVGSGEREGYVALFCGTFVLLGCAGFFFSKGIFSAEKLTALFFLCGVTVLFYWGPAVFLFSLLKQVSSYWYRYSYVGVIALVCIAARYYSAPSVLKLSGKSLVKFAAALSLCFLAADYIRPSAKLHVHLTLFCSFVVLVMLFFFLKAARKNMRVRRLPAVLLVLAVCGELVLNAFLSWKQSGVYSAGKYRAYVSQESAQISNVQKFDTGNYRLHQTVTRNFDPKNRTTANYNEALAYHYRSISGYTSSPDNAQLAFLDKLGYNQNGSNMCITNTPILTADSLLGVKYLLLPHAFAGLRAISELGTQNDKSVYQNPYCLPFAFQYTAFKQKETAEGDPFIYQNTLYSALSGNQADLYKWAEVCAVRQISEEEIQYTVNIPDGNYVGYGIIDSKNESKISVDGVFQTTYAKWAAPRVFSFGQSGVHTVTIKTAGNAGTFVAGYRFYYLDLDLLKQMTRKIASSPAKSLKIKDGSVRCTVNGKAGNQLYLSVPYDPGWEITRNGKPISPTLIGNCMISIPLTDGNNVIEMKYIPPGLILGVGLTFGCAALLVLLSIFKGRKRSNI